jgi:hypothetical protein
MIVSVTSTVLRMGPPSVPADGLAEQVAGDIDDRKAPTLFRFCFVICFDKEFDRLVAGVHFDAERRVSEVDFVTPVVFASQDRMRHFQGTSANRGGEYSTQADSREAAQQSRFRYVAQDNFSDP